MSHRTQFDYAFYPQTTFGAPNVFFALPQTVLVINAPAQLRFRQLWVNVATSLIESVTLAFYDGIDLLQTFPITAHGKSDAGNNPLLRRNIWSNNQYAGAAATYLGTSFAGFATATRTFSLNIVCTKIQLVVYNGGTANLSQILMALITCISSDVPPEHYADLRFGQLV